MKLTIEDRTRRTVILSGHCLRNIACYRAGRNWRGLRVSREFWKSANSAFIDLAVLEWCKLFADRRGQHHWSLAVSNPDAFITGLHSRLRTSESGFIAYIKTVTHYRNKFVAHLDEEKTMHIPRLRAARTSAAYLYDHLLSEPASLKWFLPREKASASTIYRLVYTQAWLEHHAGKTSLEKAPTVTW